jgi:hypothetical protein
MMRHHRPANASLLVGSVAPGAEPLRISLGDDHGSLTSELLYRCGRTFAERSRRNFDCGFAIAGLRGQKAQ